MATTVEIPGKFVAVYEDGKIDRFVFTPFASFAGYFGDAAIVTDDEPREDIDAGNIDGPFWKAVQAALAGTEDIAVRWEE